MLGMRSDVDSTNFKMQELFKSSILTKKLLLHKMPVTVEIALRKARKKEMEKVAGKAKEVDSIIEPFKPIPGTEP